MSKGFLVLTRKQGQAIHITTPQGDVIEVALIQMLASKQSRIGIKCGKEFRISRVEGISPRKETSSFKQEETV